MKSKAQTSPASTWGVIWKGCIVTGLCCVNWHWLQVFSVFSTILVHKGYLPKFEEQQTPPLSLDALILDAPCISSLLQHLVMLEPQPECLLPSSSWWFCKGCHYKSSTSHSQLLLAHPNFVVNADILQRSGRWDGDPSLLPPLVLQTLVKWSQNLLCWHVPSFVKEHQLPIDVYQDSGLFQQWNEQYHLWNEQDVDQDFSMSGSV